MLELDFYFCSYPAVRKGIEMEMCTCDLLFLYPGPTGNQSPTPHIRSKAAGGKPEGNIYSVIAGNASQIP